MPMQWTVLGEQLVSQTECKTILCQRWTAHFLLQCKVKVEPLTHRLTDTRNTDYMQFFVSLRLLMSRCETIIGNCSDWTRDTMSAGTHIRTISQPTKGMDGWSHVCQTGVRYHSLLFSAILQWSWARARSERRRWGPGGRQPIWFQKIVYISILKKNKTPPYVYRHGYDYLHVLHC